MIQAIEMQDNYKNKFFLINENGNWRLFNRDMQSYALSTISSESAELYINLRNSENALGIVRKYADYVKRDTIKYYEAS